MTAAQAKAVPYTCTPEEARALTAQIRIRADDLWRLLSRAYEIRAWAALEHPTWESYVRAEFGIGRSRSYQLLHQAEVIREIAAAADLSTPVDVTEAAARDLKPRLSEVTEQVAAAVADVPVEDRPAVVEEVVRDAREQFIADRKTGEVLSPEQWAAANPAMRSTASPETPGSAVDPPPVPDPNARDEDWSPSGALDRSRRSLLAGKRPALPPRPATIEQEFTDAALQLHKAVDRVERLTADPRFATYAHKVANRHHKGIVDAVEGLKIALIRMPGGAQ